MRSLSSLQPPIWTNHSPAIGITVFAKLYKRCECCIKRLMQGEHRLKLYCVSGSAVEERLQLGREASRILNLCTSQSYLAPCNLYWICSPPAVWRFIFWLVARRSFPWTVFNKPRAAFCLKPLVMNVRAATIFMCVTALHWNGRKGMIKPLRPHLPASFLFNLLRILLYITTVDVTF